MSGLAQRKRSNWTIKEEQDLKKIYRDKQILKLLDDEKYRRDSVYAIVCKEMEKLGHRRTIQQIKQKWQSLKRYHYAGKAQNRVSESQPSVLHDTTLDTRPSSDLPSYGANTSASNFTEVSSAADVKYTPFVLEEADLDGATHIPPYINVESLVEAEDSQELMFDDLNEAMIPTNPQTMPDTSSRQPEITPEPQAAETSPSDEARGAQRSVLSDRLDLPARPDRSKGRDSYEKALNEFHEKWEESCNKRWEKQREFWKEQAEEQREWEIKMMQSERQHELKLTEMRNAAFESAIDKLIKSRQPSDSIAYPFFMVYRK